MRIRTLFSGAFTALLLITGVVPGAATASESATRQVAGIPGPFKIMNPRTGLCFDSGPQVAYHGRCNSTDVGQRWGWWNGGFLISLQSGKCLNTYEVYPYLALGSCNNESSGDYWIHQNSAIRNNASGRCVHVGVEGEGLKAEPCVSTSSQVWSVTYW